MSQLSTTEHRRKILALESEMRKYEQLEMVINHHFGGGIYAREMLIPAGTLITGKIHKHEHISVMTKGRLRIATEDGPVEISAPYISVSPPGTKRAVYALEDSIWICFHATEERDLEKIESQFIAKDFDELIEHQEDVPCLGEQ